MQRRARPRAAARRSPSARRETRARARSTPTAGAAVRAPAVRPTAACCAGGPKTPPCPPRQLVARTRRAAAQSRRTKSAAVAGALDEIGAADEARHEARLRLVVERAGVIDLLDAALVHDRDAVGGHHRLGLVVRDVDGGDVKFVMQAPDFEAHLLAQGSRPGWTAARRAAAPTAGSRSRAPAPRAAAGRRESSAG